jgi:hypothetical protein
MLVLILSLQYYQATSTLRSSQAVTRCSRYLMCLMLKPPLSDKEQAEMEAHARNHRSTEPIQTDQVEHHRSR